MTAKSELMVERATFTEAAKKGVIKEAIKEMMRTIRLLFIVSKITALYLLNLIALLSSSLSRQSSLHSGEHVPLHGSVCVTTVIPG